MIYYYCGSSATYQNKCIEVTYQQLYGKQDRIVITQTYGYISIAIICISILFSVTLVILNLLKQRIVRSKSHALKINTVIKSPKAKHNHKILTENNQLQRSQVLE
ncbi:Hypothetical_protein [Hexamita inflata]|uniref:Hypothetical_protein n=1 Tax=Hexamita inflata TaxID=28002 RepID=A0AA86RQB5_9EUKA|nr:Hypothetical protein HINF_LOCUS63802 [Hexamita inflata]